MRDARRKQQSGQQPEQRARATATPLAHVQHAHAAAGARLGVPDGGHDPRTASGTRFCGSRALCTARRCVSQPSCSSSSSSPRPRRRTRRSTSPVSPSLVVRSSATNPPPLVRCSPRWLACCPQHRRPRRPPDHPARRLRPRPCRRRQVGDHPPRGTGVCQQDPGSETHRCAAAATLCRASPAIPAAGAAPAAATQPGAAAAQPLPAPALPAIARTTLALSSAAALPPKPQPSSARRAAALAP